MLEESGRQAMDAKCPLANLAMLCSVPRLQPPGLRAELIKFLRVAIVVTLEVLLLLQSAGNAVSLRAADKIDRYIMKEMKRQHIPGLAVGVYRQGRIVKAKGYGLADLEQNVRVKPVTMFESGSIGKQFTATGIMMLVEQGKISLDDSITKYFPGAPATWEPVKVKHLLSHTSGIGDYSTRALTQRHASFDYRSDFTEDELLSRIEALPLVFQPGEEWKYCNTNYMLLGMLIHKVTGQFYGDFLAQHIFKPLGMISTRVFSEVDIIPHRASGYELKEGRVWNQEWVSQTFNSIAAGGLYINIPDLAKWDAALYSNQLLRQSSLNKMWAIFLQNDGQANKGNYGFGWVINTVNGHRILQHEGAWRGFSTVIVRYPDDGLTVTILVNLDAQHTRLFKFAQQVAGMYNSALTPDTLEPIRDTNPGLTRSLRQTLLSILTGKPNPEDFTPKMREGFFPDFVKDLGEYFRKDGPMMSFELVKSSHQNTGWVRKYFVTLRDNTYYFDFTVNPDGKIAHMGFAPE
ncbi:MAG: serine hydrolase domain-containing protein [Pyrinomonadaceae bacterium]